MCASDFSDFIEELCEASGKIVTNYFRAAHALQSERKADDSPVTQADREAEQVMREMIMERYPEHGIIAEEFGNHQEDAEYVWVLDPIDGTISFAAGCPLFGTLVGLMHAGRPQLGAIYQPVLRQLCLGDCNKTTLNGEPVRVSRVRSLSEATLCTTDLTTIGNYQDVDGFNSLSRACRTVRGWGDCYGYLLLACGGIDIMLDPVVNPWDVLPLIPVITGAGGSITSWTGDDPVSASSCLACNPALYPEVCKLLNPIQ